MPDFAIYTAITSNYDSPRVPEVVPEDTDFLMFTDGSVKVPAPWQERRLEGHGRGASRQPKIAGIEGYEFTLWLDGSWTLKEDPRPLIGMCLDPHDIAFHDHPNRHCAYHEARAVANMRLDDEVVVKQRMDRYKDEGFPEDAGLIAGAAILRHHTPEVAAFNKLWWAEYSEGGQRDQLSANYCLWKLGMAAGLLPGFYLDNRYYRGSHRRG